MAKALSLSAGAALALLCATAAPQPAAAFCGFFVSGADTQLLNNASQAVLLRKGNHTVMTLSNNYKGPPEDFAMVVPVPVVLQKENVKTLSPKIFEHIDQLSAPRLVEYWEQDPCNQPAYDEDDYASAKKKSGGMRRSASSGANKDLGVKVEAQFTVGEYEIVILSAQDSTGLDKWLRINKYKIPAGADKALAPYVRDQSKFFVAKVDIKKVRRDSHGAVVLSPLRFGFDAAELRLPIRLGLLNAPSGNEPAAKQDLIVYVLHPESRYELANYKNLFIPTNVEVADAVRTQFGSFYAELFDETLRRAGGKGVITEYAWQTTSCDPCPTPPLSYSDLYTLGDEQVFGKDAIDNSGDDSLLLKRAMPGRRGRGGFFGGGPTWVLTRLHTRYDKTSLSEDLVFRAAKPVFGGRANGDGTVGDQGAQIQEGGVNNFQGRYIIRHYWKGAVACAKPQYGVWGGPPGDEEDLSGGGAKAATDLANAARGKVSLAGLVQSPLPSLGLKGVERKLRKGESAPTPAK